MLPPKHPRPRGCRPQSPHLPTSSSVLSLSPISKRDRLFVLIDDYFKSLSEVDVKDLAEEDREEDWVSEQKEFIKLLKKKMDKFRHDKEYEKYVNILDKAESKLERVQRRSLVREEDSVLGQENCSGRANGIATYTNSPAKTNNRYPGKTAERVEERT